mmetsp:Transcript_5654/g.14354  ORF Transcript_5654/g.14354 Transcript_5654/m.14354 type:complete len:193 (+) Transcript_5654:262-840(+)
MTMMMIPEELICPISLDVMKDPVRLETESNRSYDCQSLCQSLLRYPTLDPLTGQRRGGDDDNNNNISNRNNTMDTAATATAAATAAADHNNGEMLTFSPNLKLRQLLIDTYGEDAYQPYDTTDFYLQYAQKWQEQRQQRQREQQEQFQRYRSVYIYGMVLLTIITVVISVTILKSPSPSFSESTTTNDDNHG